MKRIILFLTILAFSSVLEASEISLNSAAQKNGIELGAAQTSVQNFCRTNFVVNSQRIFNNRRSAQSFCSSVFNRTGFDNFCFVRQYSTNRFESSFRLGGFANRNSFFNGLLAILQFLQDSGLLDAIFGLETSFEGSSSC